MGPKASFKGRLAWSNRLTTSAVKTTSAALALRSTCRGFRAPTITEATRSYSSGLILSLIVLAIATFAGMATWRSLETS